MMRFLPQRGALLGEAACHFDLAYQHLLKAILRLDAAEIEVSEEVGAIVEDVAGLACGATALADEYAGDIAAAGELQQRRRA